MAKTGGYIVKKSYNVTKQAAGKACTPMSREDREGGEVVTFNTFETLLNAGNRQMPDIIFGNTNTGQWNVRRNTTYIIGRIAPAYQ
jgi:hypothetical protein